MLLHPTCIIYTRYQVGASWLLPEKFPESSMPPKKTQPERRVAYVSIINPFSTTVPFWGQFTYNLSGLSPKQDCSPKRVNTYLVRIQQWCCCTLSGSEVDASPFTPITSCLWPSLPVSPTVTASCLQVESGLRTIRTWCFLSGRGQISISSFRTKNTKRYTSTRGCICCSTTCLGLGNSARFSALSRSDGHARASCAAFCAEG